MAIICLLIVAAALPLAFAIFSVVIVEMVTLDERAEGF